MNVRVAAQDPGGKNAIAPVIDVLRARGATVGGEVAAPDLFLAGTSGCESPDKHILAELGATPSVYVMDFWSNYWPRFSLDGTKESALLPTRICVIDEHMKSEMVRAGFPEERLAVTGNPHFDHFADAITRGHEEQERMLFISQPLSTVMALAGSAQSTYDEYTVLADLISIVEALPEPYYLSVRLHPKESADKYTKYLGPRVRLATELTLEEALSHSGLVIGMFSPVLIQAAAASKKVVSYEPGLVGADPLESNRVGVTTRVDSKESLRKVLQAYTRGEWQAPARPMRDVWPLGATERVLAVINSLVSL